LLKAITVRVHGESRNYEWDCAGFYVGVHSGASLIVTARHCLSDRSGDRGRLTVAGAFWPSQATHVAYVVSSNVYDMAVLFVPIHDRTRDGVWGDKACGIASSSPYWVCPRGVGAVTYPITIYSVLISGGGEPVVSSGFLPAPAIGFTVLLP